MPVEDIFNQTTTILNARTSAKKNADESQEKFVNNKKLLLNLEDNLNNTQILSTHNKYMTEINYVVKNTIHEVNLELVTMAQQIYADCRQIEEDKGVNKIEYDKFENVYKELLSRTQNDSNITSNILISKINDLQKQLEIQTEDDQTIINKLKDEVKHLDEEAESVLPDMILIKYENLKADSCLFAQKNIELSKDLLEIPKNLANYINKKSTICLKLEELQSQQNRIFEEVCISSKELDKTINELENDNLTVSKLIDESKMIFEENLQNITDIKIRSQSIVDDLSILNENIEETDKLILNISETANKEISLNTKKIADMENYIACNEKIINLNMELEKLELNYKVLQEELRQTNMIMKDLELEHSELTKKLQNVTAENAQQETQIEEVDLKTKEFYKNKVELFEKLAEQLSQNNMVISEKQQVTREYTDSKDKELAEKQKEYTEIETFNKKLTTEIEEIQLLLPKLQSELEVRKTHKEKSTKEENDLDNQIKLVKQEIHKNQKLIKDRKNKVKTRNKPQLRKGFLNLSSDESGF